MGFKRICEITWHQQIGLKKFERCPICNSTAFHLSTTGIPEDDEEEIVEEDDN